MSYYVQICVRDGEKTIGATLHGLIKQTALPTRIIIVNDGSTDRTGDIIAGYQARHPGLIEVIRTENKTRDYRRIPSLLNLIVERAPAACDFHMNAAGDCRYPEDYAAKMLAFMGQNPDVAIASGVCDGIITKAPRGAGRFVRESFFKKIGGKYSENIVHESEMLMLSLYHGYRNAVVVDAPFEHMDELGHGHNFKTFGQCMRTLGYHPAFAIGRLALYFAAGRPMKRRSVPYLLWTYLTYREPKRVSPELQQYIRSRQKAAMKRAIRRVLRI